MYGIFDYLSRIVHPSLGESYLHASSIARNGCGAVLLAWGRIGKTSVMLKLITEDRWHYLSDDLVLAIPLTAGPDALANYLR